MLRIEIHRDGSWKLRGEAAFSGTVAEIKAAAPQYAIKHAHRFYIDGVLVHEEPAPQSGSANH